jgi:hypothetical protein
VPYLRLSVPGFPPRRPGLDLRSGHVGFVTNNVSLGQIFFEYFGFPYQFSSRQILHSRLSSGAGTIGQLVADVPNGLGFTPPPQKESKITGCDVAEAVKHWLLTTDPLAQTRLTSCRIFLVDDVALKHGFLRISPVLSC